MRSVYRFGYLLNKETSLTYLVSSGKKGRHQTGLFSCSCGRVHNAVISDVKRGTIKSCGCSRNREGYENHGLHKSPSYKVWCNMKDRCNNPKNSQFKDYGERGIKVCDRWSKSFKNFHDDMGDRPDGLTLDRIDNDGDYEPGNCRWADRKTQSRNTTRNVNITIEGETRCLKDWCLHQGLHISTVHSRIKTGMSYEDALEINKEK